MAMNPFKPGTTVDPEYFVGRQLEIKAYEEGLEQSGFSNPQHLAIMGERGIGKSSLLRKLASISDPSKYLIIRRDLDSSIKSLEDLVNFMLEIIKSSGISYFSTRNKIKNKVSKFFNDYSWQISLLGSGVGIESRKKMILQEFFYNELENISSNTKNTFLSICIMLDEAEHLEGIEGSWSFLRTVFSRLTENGLNYLLIVAGKLGLFSKIKEIFSPMERFFYPFELGPLSMDEVKEAITKPFKKIGRTVTQEVIDSIFKFSIGYPFIVQVFGFHLFNTGNSLIDKSTLEENLPNIMDRLDAQIFKSRYDSASPQELKILRKIADEPYNSHNAKNLSKKSPIKSKQISAILINLVKKNCLNKIKHGEYVIFHPLFAEYVKKHIIPNRFSLERMRAAR